MNALRERVSTNLDELVQWTVSPFIVQVTSFPLLAKCQMPQVEAYDSSWDPLDYLESFKTLIHLQGVLDEIMCKALPITLKGLARVWFSKLTPNSISTFKELSGHYVMVEWTLCHALHQGTKTQKILSSHTKHYAAGR